jgi:hypothetical protein
MLIRVVGNIEAAALELEGRSREKPMHLTAANFVHLDRSVGEPLQDFENFVALVALILVKRHR